MCFYWSHGFDYRDMTVQCFRFSLTQFYKYATLPNVLYICKGVWPRYIITVYWKSKDENYYKDEEDRCSEFRTVIPYLD